ncbi:MAG: UDP-N-acetylmuramate dehydrogenase [Candidatus Peribacteraceae bacterium]|nr:UDP-N-acetylmuramate dehydrogenase [Candidatus Peribacteraceae bacterium]
MFQPQSQVSLKSKTTMHIGGTARYFAELMTKRDVAEAYTFAKTKNVPLFVLGAGSNTIFADGEIQALIVQIKHGHFFIEKNRVKIDAGANLATVVATLADAGLDLSALTGIPGTVGGAIFGNAGQGPAGVWIDSFIETVTEFVDGTWKTMPRSECGFGYRESIFKREAGSGKREEIIWETTLNVPSGDPAKIKAAIEEMLKKRAAAQVAARTAGSCFKASGDVPAWRLIDAAGLRGLKIGGVQISPKHANFLVNTENKGTFSDAVGIVERVKKTITVPLDVEMRFVGEDGEICF